MKNTAGKVEFSIALFFIAHLWSALLLAQAIPVGQAQYGIGTLVVVRTDGVEDRLRGRGAVILFEQDIVRTDQASQGLLDLGEGIRLAMNENTSIQILSRWEKSSGVTKIVRVKKGQVWAKSAAGGKPLEVETATGTAVFQNAEIDFNVSETGQNVLSVIQGTAQFATAFGWCTVNASTSSSGARGRGCSPSAKANVQQVLAWTKELFR